ncbi:MAG: hypothetical protein WBK55_09565 [Alphaproteobacteria bacterium]
MKIFHTIFSWPINGLKGVTDFLGSWPIEDDTRLAYDRTRDFTDPYSDLHYLHDTEMERLVKTIENMKSDIGRSQYQ